MSYQEPERITVTCYRQGNIWLAHCLEMDIVTDASTYADAMSDMAKLLKAHLDYGRSHNLNPYHNAPLKYWPKPMVEGEDR